MREKPEPAVSKTEMTRFVAVREESCARMGYHLNKGVLRFELGLRTRNRDNFDRLSETLRGMGEIEFSILPSGE